MRTLLLLAARIDSLSDAFARVVRWGLLANALLITGTAVSRTYFSTVWADAFDMQWHFFAAGVTDAGITDAGVTDAGVTDAAVPAPSPRPALAAAPVPFPRPEIVNGGIDAGVTDAGVTDAGAQCRYSPCE